MARLLLWLAASILSADALSTQLGNRKTIKEIENEIAQRKASTLQRRDYDPALLYPEYNFSTPVDHFHNDSKYAPHSDATFPMRYWFDASHYKPGGPVIVLQGGETAGSDRLPYLQKGILAQLAQATHGIGVILEHRYYGTSIPTSDLSVENLRFLTTQQALADQAYFAQNIKFPGLHGDLTSKTTPYIAYGGSYAGAFVAFLRVVYPDVYWGAISSSGVTKAIYDYWQYFDPIAEYAPAQCMTLQKTLINVIDNIFSKDNATLTSTLKSAFGLGNLTYNDDFGSLLANNIYSWQSLNWDPAVGSPEFYHYCDNLTAPAELYPATDAARNTSAYLIQQGGYAANESLVTAMLNLIGYTNLTEVSTCTDETLDECFSGHDRQAFYEQDDLDQWSWRSWPWQYCTEWGFLQTGDVPQDQLPIVSRALTLDYESIVCREAFNITTPSDVDIVNQYGGYDISYPRLAIIDGEWDPWRPATPHAFGYGAKDRVSTLSEPFILIDDAVHHWDENGLFKNETTAALPPQPIKDAQRQELIFVTEWLWEWKKQCDEQPGFPWSRWHGDLA